MTESEKKFIILLPVKTATERSVLERMGIIVGQPEADYSMLVPCELPPGWGTRRTGNPNWTHLVDNLGRLRAKIFDNLVFGPSHCADMRLLARLSVAEGESGNTKKRFAFAEVRVSWTVLFRTNDYRPAADETIEDARAKATAEAVAWADKFFPEWRNPNAYWDHHDNAIALSAATARSITATEKDGS